MKQVMCTNDFMSIAFAKAMLQGEGIDCHEWDVNMATLEGGIGAFPRRLVVAERDFHRAVETLKDNGIPVNAG